MVWFSGRSFSDAVVGVWVGLSGKAACGLPLLDAEGHFLPG